MRPAKSRPPPLALDGNERVAQATVLTEEVAGAAAGFVNPDAFRAINSARSWF